MVFSIIQNVKKFVDKGKDLDLFKLQSAVWYDKSTDFTKRHCKRIYNEIENHYYTYYDLAIFLMYELIFFDKNILNLITEKDINITSKLFTEEQLEKDQNFIIALGEQIKLAEIADYFKINRTGGNIVYDNLILKKLVSPYFYIECQEIVEREEEKENEELKRFVRIIIKINEILTKKKTEKKKNG